MSGACQNTYLVRCIFVVHICLPGDDTLGKAAVSWVVVSLGWPNDRFLRLKSSSYMVSEVLSD